MKNGGAFLDPCSTIVSGPWHTASSGGTTSVHGSFGGLHDFVCHRVADVRLLAVELCWGFFGACGWGARWARV